LIPIRTYLLSICPPFLRDYISRIQASPLGYRLARGMFWSLAGTVISRGLALVSSILVARMLGKVAFGEFGIIQSTISMFGAFAGLGLGLTATKYVAEFREKDPPKAGRIIALSSWVSVASGVLMAVWLVILAPWLATSTLAAPHLAPLLRISACLLLLSAVNGAQTGALAGFEAFKTIANVNLWSGIAAFPLMVVGAKLAGLNGVVWGLVLSMVFNWLLNYFALKREVARRKIPVVLTDYRSELSILWHYSLPALLASVMVGPITWACNALLVNRPSGYAEMGLFNAANQWFSALMVLPGVLGQAVLPMFSERLGNDDTVRAKRILTTSLIINAAIVLPMILVGSILSPIIMSFYGNGFQGGWPTLVIMLVTAGLVAIQAPVGSVIQASGRMWLAALMNLGWGLAFLIGTLLGARYGAIGLAIARSVAYLLSLMWTFWFTSSLLRPSKAGQHE
jgi:O-antigen/teichoic acid export membrane protein